MNRLPFTPRGTRASVAARARRVVLPLLALLLVLSAGAQALAFGRSGFLGQMGGALGAAAAPLVVVALLRPRLTLVQGGVTAFVLAAFPLWICGWILAKLPIESAAILAAAPLAAQRRWWLGALVATAAGAFATYLAYAANPSTPW